MSVQVPHDHTVGDGLAAGLGLGLGLGGAAGGGRVEGPLLAPGFKPAALVESTEGTGAAGAAGVPRFELAAKTVLEDEAEAALSVAQVFFGLGGGDAGASSSSITIGSVADPEVAGALASPSGRFLLLPSAPDSSLSSPVASTTTLSSCAFRSSTSASVLSFLHVLSSFNRLSAASATISRMLFPAVEEPPRTPPRPMTLCCWKRFSAAASPRFRPSYSFSLLPCKRLPSLWNPSPE